MHVITDKKTVQTETISDIFEGVVLAALLLTLNDKEVGGNKK